MNESSFWHLIEISKNLRKNFSDQIDFLTKSLAKLPEQEIIDFEFRFREALVFSSSYEIMAASKIIIGYVSDDSFLYFRCRLIAEGKDFFYNANNNPDCIAENDIQDLEYEGEEMLYISDNAFVLKFGEDTNKDLPRDAANEYIDYNNWNDIKGEDWDENELPLKYPKLWSKYLMVT